MLQDMTTIAIRHDVSLPAPLVLTGKALAQMQLATAELDPDLDPFSVAGSFMAKSAFDRLRNVADPQTVLYETQKIKVRVGRLIESFERLIGARPGPKLQVQFRGIEGHRDRCTPGHASHRARDRGCRLRSWPPR